MKKKLYYVLFFLIFLTLVFTTASAHSGRTDSNGGHYNHSTGEYHYHHGYPEHQHTNGICPYTSDHTKKKSEDDSGIGIIVLPCLGGIFVIGFAISKITNCIQEKDYSRKQIINNLLNCEIDTTSIIKPILNDSAKYCNLLSELQKHKSSLPKGVTISHNNELHSTPNDIYTVYTTHTGRTIHKTKGCSGATIAVNISKVLNKKPCKLCFCSKLKQIEPGYVRNIISDVSSVWYKSYIYDIPKIKSQLSRLQTLIERETSTVEEQITKFKKYKQVYLDNRSELSKHRKLRPLIETADKHNIDEIAIRQELSKLNTLRNSCFSENLQEYL